MSSPLTKLLDRGLIIQGITGRQGRLETRWMLDSGTRVLAGVTPGKGGETVHGVDVYDTVKAASGECAAETSIVYAPGKVSADAAIEALEAGLRLVVVTAENTPTHALGRAMECARDHRAMLVGPNSQGIVIPGVGRIGCPGGDDPWDRFSRGNVAVVSRSGGMASELSYFISQWGYGISVQIHIGGTPTVGTRLTEAVRIAATESSTKVIVVFGEPSGSQEQELAASLLSDPICQPVLAMLPGRVADGLPKSLPLGHAPRAGSSSGTSREKETALRRAGVRIVQGFSDLRNAITELG